MDIPETVLTSRDHSLHPCAIDESSLDGLCSHIWPVDPMLHSIIIHHCRVVYIRHGEGDDVVVVGVVNVNTSDLDLTSVKKELARLWKRETNTGWDEIY